MSAAACAASSPWDAMENDPSLDPETRERIWGKYKARLSDRERWEAQRDRDYMSGEKIEYKKNAKLWD